MAAAGSRDRKLPDYRLSLARLARRLPPFRGKARALRFADAWLRRGAAAPLEAEVAGVRFSLDTRDLIDFRVLYLGLHQSHIVEHLAKRIGGRDAVLWDIGANVGSIALALASRCPRLQVHAFEPSPAVFGRRERNLGCTPPLAARVHPHRLALSDASGTSPFYESNEPFNSGVGGLASSGNRQPVPVQVPVRTGTELIDGGDVPAPAFIKLDVEGFEIEVLKGLDRSLGAPGPLEIVFEHEPYRFDERGLDRRSVVDFLQARGFSIAKLEESAPRAPIAVEPADFDRSCDLVATRP